MLRLASQPDFGGLAAVEECIMSCKRHSTEKNQGLLHNQTWEVGTGKENGNGKGKVGFENY